MTNLGVYFQDDYPLNETIELVRLAERQGFTSAWQSETRLARESTVPLAAFLARTERIRVGTGVLNNWTRNPATLACTFSTLDELGPGRAMLGIGAWYEPLAGNVGVDRRRPVRAMRETVTAVRRLLQGETVTIDGEFVRLRDVALDWSGAAARPRDVPILIGATGPRMLELAGEIGDGVLLNYLVPPVYNDDALERIAVGAERAGRSLDRIERPQLILCAVDDDRDVALMHAKRMVAYYLRQAPHVAEMSRAPAELVDALVAATSWPFAPGDLERAAALLPDDFVQGITAAGTPDDARAAVDRYVAHGATHPVLYLLGDARRAIDAFARPA